MAPILFQSWQRPECVSSLNCSASPTFKCPELFKFHQHGCFSVMKNPEEKPLIVHGTMIFCHVCIGWCRILSGNHEFSKANVQCLVSSSPGVAKKNVLVLHALCDVTNLRDLRIMNLLFVNYFASLFFGEYRLESNLLFLFDILLLCWLAMQCQLTTQIDLEKYHTNYQDNLKQFGSPKTLSLNGFFCSQ